jgi:hypothetical protein
LDAEMASMGNRLFKNTSHAFTVLASIFAMGAVGAFLGQQNKLTISTLYCSCFFLIFIFFYYHGTYIIFCHVSGAHFERYSIMPFKAQPCHL